MLISKDLYGKFYKKLANNFSPLFASITFHLSQQTEEAGSPNEHGSSHKTINEIIRYQVYFHRQENRISQRSDKSYLALKLKSLVEYHRQQVGQQVGRDGGLLQGGQGQRPGGHQHRGHDLGGVA